MKPLSLVADEVADDVALTLTGFPAEVQALVLDVYDRLVEDLLVGRGIAPEEAAGLAAETVRRIRARLDIVTCGGGATVGTA